VKGGEIPSLRVFNTEIVIYKTNFFQLSPAKRDRDVRHASQIFRFFPVIIHGTYSQEMHGNAILAVKNIDFYGKLV